MTDETYERAVAGWLTRAGDTCRQLAAQHAGLAAYVVPSTGGGGEGRSATKIRPDLPIRVEVVDLRAAIEKDARRYADLARGTLRLGVEASTSTAGRLGVIADALPDLHAADPNLTGEVVEAMWEHHRSACRVVEPPRGLRPFRIDEACPQCGHAALWVDPRGWRIGCGMPSCRSIFGVGEPILSAPVLR